MQAEAGATTPGEPPAFATPRFVALVQVILLVSAVTGLTAPVWWGAMARARGYDLVTFATMNTINTAVAAIVGTALVFYLQKFDRRKLIIACGLVMMTCEIATIFAVDKYAFFAVRAIGTTAFGFVDVLGIVYLGYSRAPSKAYGWYVTLQTIVQSASLFAVPVIEKNFGLTGLQIALASIGLSIAGLSLLLPTIPSHMLTRTSAIAPGASIPPIPWVPAIAALFASQTFAFFTQDFYAYSERFGNARHIDPEQIGFILAVTMGAGLPASLFVSWIGDRMGKVTPTLIGGAAGLVACLLLLAQELGEPGYWMALTVFSLVWSFVYPFLLSLFADIDPFGRLMVAANPFRTIFGVVMQSALAVGIAHYGLPAAAWFAAVAVVVCPLFLILSLHLNERHKARQLR